MAKKSKCPQSMHLCLEKLESIGINCIEYVGSANYNERENYAKKTFRSACEAAKEGDLDRLKEINDSF